MYKTKPLIDAGGWFLSVYGYYIHPKEACRHCSLNDNDEPIKPVQEAETRYSFGIYAGKYCDECWKKSGYKDEGPEGFDPYYAGENLDDDY